MTRRRLCVDSNPIREVGPGVLREGTGYVRYRVRGGRSHHGALWACVGTCLRRNDDGTWSEFATGTNGRALDGETIGTNNLTPGHYRLEVHNWAGPAGNPVAIKLTFLNSAGEPGS